MEFSSEIEEILLKDFTRQELTGWESAKLNDWIGTSQENQRLYAQMKMTFLHPGARDMEKLKEEVWEDLQQRLYASPAPYRERRKTTHYWSKIAAVFILLASAGLIIYQFNRVGIDEAVDTSDVRLIEKVSLPGQKVTTTLPDGTVVKLNAGSKIIAPDSFYSAVREVTLYGEAFFEVARNESKPFVIKTKDIQIQVLGTSFNVKSYPDKALSVVSVASGKVAVAGSDKTIELLHGEKATYQADSGSMVKGEFDWEEEFGWKEEILLFRGSGFHEISERLSNWYGVEFITEGSQIDPDKKFSGRYENPTLNAVLQGLSYVYEFSYRIDNKQVILNPKQMK